MAKFHTVHRGIYALHIAAERAVIRANQILTIPAKVIRFEDGRYETEDPEEIEAIRASEAYKKRKIIFEISQEDMEALGGKVPKDKDEEIQLLRNRIKKLKESERPKNIRGTMTTTHIDKKLQEKDTGKPQIKEPGAGTFKCDVPACAKIFKTKKQLAGHKMSHRKDLPQVPQIKEQ